MTAQQHRELANQYFEQSGEHFKKAAALHFAGAEAQAEFDEYQRLYKLYRKHYGIYEGVQTRKHRAWCRKNGVEYAY